MNEFRETLDWRRALRAYRTDRHLSQPEVARRAGVSLAAVKAYENGDRHPSPQALNSIIDALGMPVDDANPIRAGAGYAVDWEKILNDRYDPRDLDALAEEVERYPWPVFVTNQATDLICANRAFRRVIGMDMATRLPDKKNWNFLARASDPSFAGRMENWDAVMTFMIGIAKADTRYAVNLERPTAFLGEALRRFLEGDPVYIRRILGLWDAAPLVRHTTRMRYAIHWRHDTGALMRFSCTMHVADIWQELSWHDWIPDDAATLEAAHRPSLR